METIQTATIRRIPKIKGNLLFGNTFDLVKDPLRFMVDAMGRNERITQIRLVNRNCYLIFRAEDIKHVLQENNRNYTKSDAYKAIQLFLGNGLLNSEGDFWRRQRKLAQPAFHRQRLALLTEPMNRATLAMLRRWEQPDRTQPLNISEETMKLTLEIVSESLFSADVRKHLDHVSDSLTTIIEYAYDSIHSYVHLPLSIPTPRNRKYKKSVERIERLIYEIIAGRQNAKAGDHLDLLGMLMEAQDEETGERMNPRQLRDEVTTIFMAGHETTANALAWAFYLLAKHPAVARQVRQEVSEVLGTEGLPTYENVRNLSYTTRVIQETLRLYPPAWVIGRKTIAADQIGGYAIPAQAPILMSPYAVHRHPEYWPNPDAFDPDNFLPEREKQRPTYAYFPFGGGPRLCIGNNFALMEMQVILALTVRQFDFQPTGTQRVIPEPVITLRPKDGLRLYLNPVGN
ncbi:MAG: cytochrome P450 [Ferruginibacter sp.]|nr:cytochrome P450 [Cytophagales bacterium]